MMLWTQSQTAYHATGSSRVVLAAILLASGLLAEPSAGQTPGVEGTAQVSVPRANFRATCSMSAEVIATLTEGEEVEVLDTAGSWYHVRHTESGIEGCVHQTVLGAVTPLSEEAAEELEEWEEEIHEREAEAREAELEAERERREVGLEAREEEAERRAREAEWAARRARGEKRVTGYLDLNIGYGSPGEDRLHIDGSFFEFTDPPRPIPNSQHEDDYEYDGDTTYGVAGGFLVALYRGGSVGGGASLMRASYSVDLELEGSEPHPTRGVIVRDTISTTGPDRTETALHVHAIYAPPTPEPLQVRVFFGPTIFRVELPVWNSVTPRFFDNPPRLEFVAIEFDKLEETVVGAHVGSDVAYFFSNAFGIGGTLLYSQGKEEFAFSPPEAPSGRTVEEVTLGGLSAMIGVRFRF